MRDIDRRRQADRARNRTRFDTEHAGHRIAPQSRLGADGQPWRHCLTCRTEADPMAIVRAVAGDLPGRLKPAERRAAVAQLHPELSAARVADQLRVNPRTVWRDLAAIRTGATA